MTKTDGELVTAITHGEAEAFAELVKRYSNAVYGVAYHCIGDFHLAQDMAQEVFIKAYLKLPTLKDTEKVGSWLYSVTRRRCLNWMRNAKDDVGGIDAADHCQALLSDVEDEVIKRNTRQKVWEALKTLPEANRLAIVLHYMGGYTAREIGRFLGASEKAIEHRLRRAKDSLKRELIGMVEENLKENCLSEEFEEKVQESVAKYWQYYREGKTKDALSEIRKAAELKPDDVEIRGNLAQILSAQGMLEEAKEEYLKIVDKDPNQCLGLGRIYKNLGEFDKAVEVIKKVADQHLFIDWSRAELAEIYEAKGDYEQAILTCQQLAFQIFLSLPMIFSTLVKATKKQGDFERAEWYEKTMAGIMDAVGSASTPAFNGYFIYLDYAESLADKGKIEDTLSALHRARDAARCSAMDELSPLFDKLTLVRGKSWEGSDLYGFYTALTSRFNSLKGNPAYEELVRQTKEELDGVIGKTAGASNKQ